MVAADVPLGGMTPAAFFRDHWQKRPLLVRNAIAGFESPLDGDELAGLACDPDVESRIVTSGPDGSYALRTGPFTGSDFDTLGARGWTLLVNDVDKYLPELSRILDRFSFIPGWRIDDLMVSWAAGGGSVGPHVDRYDVFLLQGMGRRRWQVGAPDHDPAVRPDTDLAVLKHFAPVDEWLLEAGDMLYLPPGIPHHGIAEGACMTWSIGMRAPAQSELVADFADRIAQSLVDADRYADPDLDPSEAAGGRLSDAAIARARAALDSALARGDAAFPRWFGELVTAPKAWLHCVPPPAPMSRAELARRVRTGLGLVRDPRACLAWFPLPDGRLCLCVDGQSTDLPAALESLLCTLCGERAFPPGVLARYLDDDEAVALLAQLYAGGQLTADADA